MHSKRWIQAAATTAVAAILFAALPGVASAEEGDASTPLDALQVVTQDATDEGVAERQVLDNLAQPDQIVSGSDGSVSLNAEGTTTVIPGTSDEPITIGDVSLTIPSQATKGERVDDAVVAFDGADGSTTVPVLKDDGSVQITTIISDASAPTSFDYDFTLPAGVSLVLDGDSGFVTAMDGDALVIGVAPAWAVDADGRAVPTHYEVQGSTLRQVVDHTTAAVTYPVVADPWAGQRLFDTVALAGYVRGAWNVKLVTSGWGRLIQAGALGGWGQGQLILNGAGWVEATSRVSTLNNRATYYQQYQCHVLGAYTPASGGPSWDLEGYRASRPWWRTDGGAYPLKCNW